MSIKDKAEEALEKARNFDINKAKGSVSESDISIKGFKALDNQKKAILGGVVGAVSLAVIGLASLGGGHTANIESYAKVFPSNASAEEKCETAVWLGYDYWKLISQKEPVENMIAALDATITIAKAADKTNWGSMEKHYYKEISGQRRNISRHHDSEPKDKLLKPSRYEEGMERCLKNPDLK